MSTTIIPGGIDDCFTDDGTLSNDEIVYTSEEGSGLSHIIYAAEIAPDEVRTQRKTTQVDILGMSMYAIDGLVVVVLVVLSNSFRCYQVGAEVVDHLLKTGITKTVSCSSNISPRCART